MIEQFSLFQNTNNNDNPLEVVKMSFIDKSYVSPKELFQGFNHLYAITFSYGLSFIEDIIEYFDTAEIILGCEAMVKYDLKTVMAFQTRALEKINKREALIYRVKNDTLSFWIAKDMISHQKIFILTNDIGKTRVIVGSANFSAVSFSGNQRENIGYFENDNRAYDYYMNEFETLKEFSTNEIVRDCLYFNGAGEKEVNIENIPIIKEVKVKNAGVIIDDEKAKNEAVEFAFDVSELSSKYAKIIPKLDSLDGKTLLTPKKVTELVRQHKKKLDEDEYKRKINPQFKIDFNTQTVYFNDRIFNCNIVDLEIVKNDITYINEYFEGFGDFIGKTDQAKKVYFQLMNYMFLSPFIARLRYEAYKNDFSTTLFPVYAVLNGQKSAGKSAFLDTVQAIMFGKSLGGIDPANFTRTGAAAFLHECTGVPLHIEDITRERFNKNAGEIVKYEKGLFREKLINHPTFIITANDIETIKPEFAKRVYYASVDTTLQNTDAATKHKKIAELRKQITPSFYKEYFKRMLTKVDELIEEMNNFELNEENEKWQPDIFALSSQTILEIYQDCEIEIPSFVSLVDYTDYFGYNVIVENIKEKITMEWMHNRQAFKIMKKQNVLEYVAGERTYEAARVADSIPEILRPKTSGNKVIMQLDEAEKFFGIHFKKGIF